MCETRFEGFPRGLPAFFAALGRHNERAWFEAHRDAYEQQVLAPARRFVTAMGERLAGEVPGICAVPQVDQSIFRLHRDVRFSKEKQPYKTHLGIFLWEGDGKKMACPGFYLQLSAEQILVGGGRYQFTPEELSTYREAVDNPRRGAALQRILQQGQQQLGEVMGAEGYKRVPAGYDKDHPRAELLKRKGVVLGQQGPLPEAIFGPGAVDYVYDRFAKMLPLHRWLVALR